MSTLTTLLFIQLLFISSVLADGVYGEDNRAEVITSSSYKQNKAKSVAAMIDRQKYQTFVASGSFMPEISFEKEHEVCSDERFSQQPSLADCTGFLIAPNKILTAGHCVVMEANPCEDFIWVFDYKDAHGEKNYLKEAQVAICKNIQTIKFDPVNKVDYAIIELTENLERPVLKISQKKSNIGDKLFTVGHPNGLPQKVTDNGFILDLKKNFFGNKLFQIVHNLDLFTGNSGSPIIDESSGEVIAIAISGEDDFQEDENCNRVKTYIMKPDLAEVAMSIFQIRELK